MVPREEIMAWNKIKTILQQLVQLNRPSDALSFSKDHEKNGRGGGGQHREQCEMPSSARTTRSATKDGPQKTHPQW